MKWLTGVLKEYDKDINLLCNEYEVMKGTDAFVLIESLSLIR